MRKSIIPVIVIILFSNLAYADTVIMKNKTKIKGLVVDEYVDRVALSTIEGEKYILRKEIDIIEYDTPEQNFMQLGRAYEEKGWHNKAAFYYKKAMDINPDYKDAREAYLASHAKIWREEEKSTKKEVELFNMAAEWQRSRKNKLAAPVAKNKENMVKDGLGINLAENNGIFAISEVTPGSSAAKAGIQKGDFLTGIWGRLIRYSKLEDVLNELSGPRYSEVKVLLEKDISVSMEAKENFYKELGVSLGFEYEGLVVKDVTPGKKGDIAGLKKGDFIIAIDKNITRYLPMDSIIALISSPKNNTVVFTVSRVANLRREGE